MNYGTALCLGLVAALAGAAGGVAYRDHQQRLQGAFRASLCPSEGRIEGWIAVNDDGLVCFKQNSDNKKISKSLIVEDF